MSDHWYYKYTTTDGAVWISNLELETPSKAIDYAMDTSRTRSYPLVSIEVATKEFA